MRNILVLCAIIFAHRIDQDGAHKKEKCLFLSYGAALGKDTFLSRCVVIWLRLEILCARSRLYAQQ